VRPPAPDGSLDRAFQQQFGLVAGVDEVGRGALAGPVLVGAVILPRGASIPGLHDSKLLSPSQRERLAPRIRQVATAWALAERSADEIDASNILVATRAAMAEALAALVPRPAMAICDGVAALRAECPVVAEPRADGRYLCVAAASVLAKVERDRRMVELARPFPHYGWERNKGYGTPQHLRALRLHGPSPLHRRSFAPVRVLACLRGKASSHGDLET